MKIAESMRIAILDDYQSVALSLADWKSLPGGTEVVAFSDHVSDPEQLLLRLSTFDAVCLMRVGLGHLGIPIANVARAFGMEVIAWSPNLTQERAAGVGVRAVSKAELFSTADAITIHMPLSERSRGLVGRADLDAMKRTAFLINTSRPGIVDQTALLDALLAFRIGGLGVDVFEEEPLPIDAPFRYLPNVATPHIGYVAEESYRPPSSSSQTPVTGL